MYKDFDGRNKLIHREVLANGGQREIFLIVSPGFLSSSLGSSTQSDVDNKRLYIRDTIPSYERTTLWNTKETMHNIVDYILDPELHEKQWEKYMAWLDFP